MVDYFEFKDGGKILYKIVLESVKCEGNIQEWKYTVTKEDNSAANISNWSLELCKDITTQNIIYDSANPKGEVGDPNTGEGKGNCLNKDNPIGCFKSNIPVVENQIKWDTTGGTFEFKLDSCYNGEKVHVAIKAGAECFCGEIIGPSCYSNSTRGILFI